MLHNINIYVNTLIEKYSNNFSYFQIIFIIITYKSVNKILKLFVRKKFII